MKKPRNGKALDRHQRSLVLAVLPPSLAPRGFDVAADHGADNLRQRRRAYRSVIDRLAVAHHGQVVADFEDFREVVRNEHEPHSARGQLTDQFEHDAHLAFRQRRRRFVENQDARVQTHRLDDLHHFLESFGSEPTVASGSAAIS